MITESQKNAIRDAVLQAQAAIRESSETDDARPTRGASRAEADAWKIRNAKSVRASNVARGALLGLLFDVVDSDPFSVIVNGTIVTYSSEDDHVIIVSPDCVVTI